MLFSLFSESPNKKRLHSTHAPFDILLEFVGCQGVEFQLFDIMIADSTEESFMKVKKWEESPKTRLFQWSHDS